MGKSDTTHTEVLARLTDGECARALDFFGCQTKHVNERMERIERTGLGIGTCIAGFMVDKHHKNGLEEHYITTSGLIVVRNHRTGKAVTIMVARPGQIRRYYRAFNMRAPQGVIDIAIRNTELGYNY